MAKKSLGSFIANSTRLGGAGFMQIITGPNMGGKSTYMRQVAIIVLLASIGSFVPAAQCRIGPIDAIYTRLGAADDLANAQSTFMLEMTEAAQILRHASAQSLVLLDEIGRGTSTYDGLALAAAIASYLHDKSCALTLFATHYFELTQFPKNHVGAHNVHVVVSERGHEITFLHEIMAGPASKSYGIHVAKLAGIPHTVIHQARRMLIDFEAQKQSSSLQLQYGFTFDEPETPIQVVAEKSQLQIAIEAVDPDTLTPREALALIFHLKSIL
jgi:DNA mismatch repair protein MutS